MKALITGGTGFIGRRLASILDEKGHSVTIMSRSKPSGNFSHAKCDLKEKDKVIGAVKGNDAVFHLGALIGTDYLTEGFERVEESVDVNIKGSLYIFEGARRFNSVVINAGLVPDWPNPYMITKKAAAKFGQMYFNEYGTDIRTLEFTHVYGPGQKEKPVKKAIPRFILAALRNEPITVFGKGSNKMDCIYVDDVAKAMIIAAENSSMKGMVVPVGTGKSVTVLELARKITKMSGSTSKIELKPMRPGEPEKQKDFGDVSLGLWKKYNKWFPATSLDEGLKMAIGWCRKNSI